MRKIDQYGILGVLKLSKNLVLTKMSFSKARLIRFPIDIRNKKNIDFGKE